MTPIQQLFLGTGSAVDSKTYVDDLFSTNVYIGAGSGQVINNGIDNSSEGGMVWFKRRDGTYDHQIVDTIRGGNKGIRPNLDPGEITTTYISSFNNNGYTLGNENAASQSGLSFAAWNFRKAPGFFDVVTYTGNGTAGRTVSHSLGSVPGMIIIKRTDTSSNWVVYHRGTDETNPANYRLRLNTSNQRLPGHFNSTEPTATVFTLGTDSEVNANGGTYVAYVFAGGEDQTTATARSVDFVSGVDRLVVGSSSDLSFGTGDFTIEGWFREETESNMGLFQISSSSDGFTQSDFSNTIALGHNSGGWNPYGNGQTSTPSSKLHLNYSEGQWIHFAYTRESGTNRIFINGDLLKDWNSSYNYTHTYLAIGLQYSTNNRLNGEISNFRIVKGTAVYTSAFRVPTKPLTNITNTKLLCCNNSNVTGSTVTPTTISRVGGGGAVASADSPFDDPAGFVFGENEDQNVIKCGSYVGNGSSDGQSVHLGFEPQFIIQKNVSTDTGGTWNMYDSMRGVVTGGNDRYFRANTNQTAGDADLIEFTPTGFNIIGSGGNNNGDGRTFIYIAIRRSDGYVGKPAKLATDVFNIDLDGTNSGNPSWVSGFPVDMQFIKDRAGTTFNWFLSTRLTQGKYLSTESTAAEVANSVYLHDYQNGWGNYSSANGITSWMWKRHAGFDVLTYAGVSATRTIQHSMGKVPEMMWIKSRTSTDGWEVYHKGLNGGTTPASYSLRLDTSATESNIGATGKWSDITSTSVTLHSNGGVNFNSKDFIMMLFASVSGISSVGYYDGSSSSQTISTGFAPRFVMIKCTTNAEDWYLLDTTRGWASGNDNILRPNLDAAQYSNDLGAPTSTGFTLTVDNGSNAAGRKYIYYAHS